MNKPSEEAGHCSRRPPDKEETPVHLGTSHLDPASCVSSHASRTETGSPFGAPQSPLSGCYGVSGSTDAPRSHAAHHHRRTSTGGTRLPPTVTRTTVQNWFGECRLKGKRAPVSQPHSRTAAAQTHRWPHVTVVPSDVSCLPVCNTAGLKSARPRQTGLASRARRLPSSRCYDSSSFTVKHQGFPERRHTSRRSGVSRQPADDGPFTPAGKALTEGTGSPDEQGSAQCGGALPLQGQPHRPRQVTETRRMPSSNASPASGHTPCGDRCAAVAPGQSDHTGSHPSCRATAVQRVGRSPLHRPTKGSATRCTCRARGRAPYEKSRE